MSEASVENREVLKNSARLIPRSSAVGIWTSGIYFLSPRQELNLDLLLRREKFYPLKYGEYYLFGEIYLQPSLLYTYCGYTNLVYVTNH